MAYLVRVMPHAERALANLPKKICERVRGRIDALADHPRPHGVKKLQGFEDRWRIRVGDYRVIYEIHDRVLLVLVVEIGHRREVYR